MGKGTVFGRLRRDGKGRKGIFAGGGGGLSFSRRWAASRANLTNVGTRVQVWVSGCQFQNRVGDHGIARTQSGAFRWVLMIEARGAGQLADQALVNPTAARRNAFGVFRFEVCKASANPIRR